MNDTKPALPEPYMGASPVYAQTTTETGDAFGDQHKGPMYPAVFTADQMHAYADQCTAAAQARVAELEGALRSLVELKDFKATIAQGSLHEAEHKKAQYRTRQPRVWAAARAALASTSGAEPERGHSAAEVGEGQKARRSWPAQGARSHTPREAEMATAERGDAGGQSPASSAMPASPPVVQPDAVATLHDDGCFTWKRDEFRLKYDRQRAGWRMDVYASHPHAEMKTLTDAEISELWRQAAEREYTGTTETLVRSFARAIERALAAKNGAKNAS